ncbi:helix-turn-helix transcriptional regulator [Pseudaquidulcibacter saccharophilus]|uniref:helix-turn-helix transcriptional regulator n=1 Tax=Pseudaquidulcibacter saccharophilus TaxID=2831900 RepID=UPI001EFF43F1|nr:helix-turn-helix transcriptional regulator [Pseudaquidulcibacter saccharophilus]
MGKITNNIRTLRFMNGEMSQGELGEKVGVTRQTIAAIETGKYSPSLEVAFKIAGVFNVTLLEVFGWEISN